jgi:hypothetical protein
LTALVFHPVIGCYFYSDDFLNLFQIGNDPLLQYLTTPNGGHMLVTRNAVFYLMAHAVGPQPAYYYASGLVTHLLNVWLCFRVVRAFTSSVRLASFGAGLWGSCPLNIGSLGWYAVYGHLLVGTALLLILGQAVHAAQSDTPPSAARLAWWYALALLAATSFGTGMAIAIALPFALHLLAPAWRPRFRFGLPLASLVVVVPVLYTLLKWLYEYLADMSLPLSGAASLLLSYWRDDFGSLARVMGIGWERLLLGFIFPAWIFPAGAYVLLVALLIAVVVVVRRSAPIVRGQLLACCVLLLAVYGLIAVARASIVRDASGDLLTTLSRYQYSGQLLLTVMLCVILGRVQAALQLSERWKTALLLAWYGFTLVSFALLAPTIDQHPEAREQTDQTLGAIQTAIDAGQEGQPVYIKNRNFPPLPAVAVPFSLFPGWAAAFTIFYPQNTVDGRTVYFIENTPAVIEHLRAGRRTGTLFVAPGQRHDQG